MEPLEIEVKFFLEDLAAMREKIKTAGAESTGYGFETNIRFEDEEKSLISNKALLRLRKDTRNLLTYKCQPPEKDDRFKIYRELEVEVSDFSTTEKILKALGYRREQVYEKRRETFSKDNSKLCLDRMPYGDFLEIEGKKEKIRELTNTLGLDWEKRILHNYLEMFEIIKKAENLPFSDLTFDNFNKYPIRFSSHRHLFVKG